VRRAINVAAIADFFVMFPADVGRVADDDGRRSRDLQEAL
jgi:hypothetical protein